MVTSKRNGLIQAVLRLDWSSLRFRLFGLVLLALFPTFGLMLYSESQQHQRAAIEAQQNARRHVRLVALEQEQLIHSAHYLLIALAQLPVIRNQEPEACINFLAHLLSQYPSYSNFGAVDQDGNIFCSGKGVPVPVNISDRRYFRDAVETRDFSAGEYALTRTNPVPVISFGYPVIGDDGEPQGIVFAGLNLDRLNQFLATVPLPPNANRWVIDQYGTTLSSYPTPERWVGQPLPEAEVREQILEQREGVMEAVDVDGKPRLYAFAPMNVRGEPRLYILIGIPMEEAFAEAQQDAVRNLAGLALGLTVALVAAGWGANAFILRHVDSLVSVTKRLSEGDLSARADRLPGGGELNELADAFNEMGQALQRREAEQQHAQEQIRHQSAQTEALARIASRLNAHLDLESVLKAVCEETAAALRVPAASVCWFDETLNVLRYAMGVGLPAEYVKRTRPTPCRLYARHVQGAGPVVVIPDVRDCTDVPDAQLLAALDARTMVSAMMLREDQLVGSLNVYTFGETRVWTEDQLSFLKVLADEAAQAITNARLYDALQQEQRARATLLQKVIEAQEQERKRIARELHDDSTQSLNLLIMELDLARLTQATDLSESYEHLQRSKSTAEDMLINLRRLIADLRPSLLDDLGLVPAIAWYGEQRLKPLGIDLRMDGDTGQERLPQLVETALFRITQEALTNIVKHSGARQVLVYLRRSDGHAALTIRDDGKGFQILSDRFIQADGSGFGLLGMKERAIVLGGDFNLRTAPEQGTVITVHIPLVKEVSNE